MNELNHPAAIMPDGKIQHATPTDPFTGGELKSKVSASNFIAYNNQIMGEVLTLIDSAVPESKQQRALKSLIKQSIWRNYDVVWRWLNDQLNGKGSTFPFQDMTSIE